MTEPTRTWSWATTLGDLVIQHEPGKPIEISVDGILLGDPQFGRLLEALNAAKEVIIGLKEQTKPKPILAWGYGPGKPGSRIIYHAGCDGEIVGINAEHSECLRCGAAGPWPLDEPEPSDIAKGEPGIEYHSDCPGGRGRIYEITNLGRRCSGCGKEWS